MKTKLDAKRELLPKWIEFIEMAVATGEQLAVLEDFNDKQSVARYKRNYLQMREFLITFTREEIEKIRIDIRDGKT